MESTTLEGKLGVLVCWYYSGMLDTVSTDRAMINRLVRCVPHYIDGRVKRLTTHDLLRLYDAVASYPRADAELDRVASDLFRHWQRRLIAEDPMPVRPAMADALAEVPTATLEKLTGMFQGELRRRTTA